MTGTIFDIKRFSIHDGPGIRTTVFLKGCPLRCVWCHNPESQSLDIHELFKPELCVKFDTCTKEDCPAEAYVKVGETISAAKLTARIIRDRFSFDESGGGVTFSGGEPLMQPLFLIELLKRCKAEAIHTAVDTCGYAQRDHLRAIAEIADLFLYDIKLIDDTAHQKYTGVSNRGILENLAFLCDNNSSIELRMPIIPGITDTASNLRDVATFLGTLKHVPRMRLLPHHHVAMSKYARFGMQCLMEKRADPSDPEMDVLVEYFRKKGLDVFR